MFHTYRQRGTYEKLSRLKQLTTAPPSFVVKEQLEGSTEVRMTKTLLSTWAHLSIVQKIHFFST